MLALRRTAFVSSPRQDIVNSLPKHPAESLVWLARELGTASVSSLDSL